MPRDEKDIHVHLHIPELTALSLGVARLGEQIMSALDDVRAQLAAADVKTTEIGAAVTEIASDLDDLIAKLAAADPNSPAMQQLVADATALTGKLTAQGDALTAVAAKHTP